jgi:aminoglycoside phosphotransferase (APT) family kinase protein
VNAELLRDLGFQLEGRAPGGESGGAWFAIAADGERVLLKWVAGEGMADRYAVLLPALEVLRSRGVPVPEYPLVRAVDGWTLSAQQVLPGRSFPTAPPKLVDRMIECVSAAAGIVGPPQPAPAPQGWSESVIHALTVGEDGWAEHGSLRAHSDRTRRIIDFVESVGADADAGWFPTSGLVHFDLHTDNVLALDDGTLTGIIDWEGACAGDHRYDLVAYAFDLDGHGQQIWERVEPLVEWHVLRAYAAHMTLRRTDWAIRHRPEDVPRQLDRAERVLDRFGRRSTQGAR